ncbi:MAG: 16S rRNA (guanine(527)-N(7))-methyltransferase RsmG [Alphaproteobacteria bacterium]|nr:16S rRNA (guanine(527)-N(7))-methyltransferase RsmG [Alphaproteobacteria bacterium]
MSQKTFTSIDFLNATEVTPEVLDKLHHYHARLLEWNPKINLVSASTLPDAWRRHFLDSAQLYPIYKHSGEDITMADLGSGPGFPGMVLAMMGAPNVSLIERDVRKAAFLRTIAAETKTQVELLNLNIKDIKDRQFDVITSRALADLNELLNLSEPLRKPSTHCLFLKGKNLDAELAEAQKEWVMDVRKMESVTDDEAFILRLTNIKRA